MRSKSSFFDKTVFRSVLERSWFAAPVYAVAMTFRLLQFLSRSGRMVPDSLGIAYLLQTALTQCTVICAAAAVLTAMLLYRWLFSARYTAFVTALPIRREAVFLSQAAAGFLLLTAGNLLSVLAASVMSPVGFGIRGMAYWMAVMTLLTILFFGFASFCAMLTGSLTILPAVYTVLLYAAVALEASVRLTAQFLVFGLTGQRRLFTFLSPVYHLRVYGEAMVETVYREDAAGFGSAEFSAFHGWGLLACYAAAGALFLLAAAALLKRRGMEHSGSVVAVTEIRRVFPVGAALAGAFTLSYFALRMVFGYSGYVSVGGDLPRAMILLLIMLIGAFLGWFGARGLMHKTFRVFGGGWTGFGVFAALLAAFVLGLETDVFGIERAFPKPEDVGYVSVYNPYSNVYEVRLEKPENIASALDLHRSIVSHKSLFERTERYGGGSSWLEISYYDREGKLLLNRAYSAPSGAMAWSSGGNAYATDGSAWGSANPDLASLEELMNCGEAVAQRLTLRLFAPSAYTASNGYVFVTENGEIVFNLDLTGAQAWELYHDCVLPDAADSSIGRVRLVPEPGYDGTKRQINIGIYFARRGAEDGAVDYDGLGLTVPEDAKRTNAWLAEHGLPLPEEPVSSEEPPVTSTYELPALDGLAALLEKIYLEYDPTAAGSVVSARWTRSLLDWYTDAEKDPAAVREDAELFAHRYVITESFLGSLQKLRSAGLQLVDGRSAGLVRDYRFVRLGEAEVNSLFDAITEGFDNA